MPVHSWCAQTHESALLWEPYQNDGDVDNDDDDDDDDGGDDDDDDDNDDDDDDDDDEDEDDDDDDATLYFANRRIRSSFHNAHNHLHVS